VLLGGSGAAAKRDALDLEPDLYASACALRG